MALVTKRAGAPAGDITINLAYGRYVIPDVGSLDVTYTEAYRALIAHPFLQAAGGDLTFTPTPVLEPIYARVSGDEDEGWVLTKTNNGYEFTVPPGGSGAEAAQVGLAPIDHGLVLTRNTSNSWEAGMAEGPTIFWDPGTQRYGMTYVGYDAGATNPQVGLAWSNDLVNWKRNSNSPMFSGTNVDGNVDCTVTGPFIWVEDGVYYLFYIGCSTFGFEAGTKRLCLATATSLSGPWTRRGAILSPSGQSSGPGAWRGIAIWHPNIVKNGSKYHLFINASGYGNVADERIGHATADTLLGPWTPDDNELLAHGAGGTWDATRVVDPCVYQVGDYWYMAYGGINGSATSFDGLAWTTKDEFPYNWRKHPLNPILSPLYGSNQGGARPFIVNTPAGHFHFFTAQGGGQNGIALAMQSNTVDGPWQYVGGGGDNPIADVMDPAWFPAFAANWSNFDPTGVGYPLVKFRMLAGGKNVQVTGLAKHATTLDLASVANTPFYLPVQFRPAGVRGGAALTFDAGSGLDRAGNFRVNSDGGIAYTVGPTAANSAYWLDTTVPTT